jgi:SAM-dependent methyltransferase
VAGSDDWLNLSAESDDEVRERILTGYKSGKPFTPYVPTVTLPGNVNGVLDFGCGLGRNFPYLKRIARSVAGFDLPPMIARCRTAASESVDLLSDDWEQLKVLRFDLIVASLVLQHIEPAAVRGYLRDFARMTGCVYLLTRTNTDFDENLFAVIAGTELFEPGECAEVEHDPVTHQLKVIGRTTFDQAGRSGAGRHYELVLYPAREA